MWIDSLREFRLQLTRLVRRPQFESEMNNELQFHIDAQTEQWISAGMPHDQARRKAPIESGGLEQPGENCRDAIGVRLINDIVSDLRYAVRIPIQAPAITRRTYCLPSSGVPRRTKILDGTMVLSSRRKPQSVTAPEWLLWLRAAANRAIIVSVH